MLMFRNYLWVITENELFFLMEKGLNKPEVPHIWTMNTIYVFHLILVDTFFKLIIYQAADLF